MINQIKNTLCRRTADRLTFLKYFIGLFNFIFLVFYRTHENRNTN